MEELAKLHAEVDADWKKIIEPLEKEPSLNFWTIRSLFMLWRDEKQYVDRYHMRWPTIEWSEKTKSFVAPPNTPQNFFDTRTH